MPPTGAVREEPEEGGRVYEVGRQRGGKLDLRFANRAIRFDRIRPRRPGVAHQQRGHGMAARPFTEASSPVRGSRFECTSPPAKARRSLTEWSLVNAPSVRQCTRPRPWARRSIERCRRSAANPVRPAGKYAVRTGGDSLDIEGAPFAPASLLNQMRREAVEKLQELQSAARRRRARSDRQRSPLGATAGSRLARPTARPQSASAGPHSRATRSRDRSALPPASRSTISISTACKPSLERVHAAGIQARVASPRVLKPGEERIVDFLLSCDCPILVRSAGLLHALRDRAHRALTGDFSLNAANAVCRRRVPRAGPGLAHAHARSERRAGRRAGARVGGGRIEAIAYQHLPVFHTEHCVFCRFLSTGTSYRDCGRPCEKHRVALRDHAGRAHPVMADVGCRNTVFGAEAQEAEPASGCWRAAGIRHFRLEFAHESAAQVTRSGRTVPERFGRRNHRCTAACAN